MAALTDNLATESRGELKLRDIPVAASTTIYAGSMVMVDSAGYATPAAAEVTNNNVAGVAKEKYDNSSGSAGDVWATVQMGSFRLAGTSLVQGNVGEVVYAEDDQTVDDAQSANEPIAGVLEEFISTSEGWVFIDLASNRAIAT